VKSNRIRVGVKGEYEGKVNPYIGVGLEEELSGKIKANR
jgi:hypothetical protein